MVLLFVSGISGSFAQTPSVGDYRSKLAAMNWATAPSWERWNGTLWEAATTYPGQNAGTGQVTIRNGHTIIINVSPANSISSLLVGEGTSGILQYERDSARSLSVSGMVTINSLGIFRSALTGNITNHQLIVEGSIINSGTIDFSTTAGPTGTTVNASGAGITFTGASNALFDLSGATLTNLRQTNGLVVNKGTSASSVLSFIPGGTFHVLSANSVGFLTIISGTLSLIGSNAFSNPVFYASTGSYTIPAAGGFWLGNRNAQIVGMDGTLTNAGEIIIRDGIYNIGTGSGNESLTTSTGRFEMSGGTMNISGRFRINDGDCTITGGTINLATVGHFDKSKGAFHISQLANLIISGDPLITFTHPNSNPQPFNDIEILYGTGAKSITGGTFRMGTSATTTNSTFLVNSDIPLYNLTIFNNKSKISLAGHLTVKNQLVMNGGNLVAPNDTVTITNSATNAINRTSGIITGTLERAIAASGNPTYTFPVGNGSNYTPIELSFNNISNGGYISVISVGRDNPNLSGSVLNSTKSVNNYWRIANRGVLFLKLNGMITFPSKLLDPGVNISNLRFGVYNNINWSYPSTSLFTGNSYTFSDLPALVNSSFALAECMLPTIAVGTNPVLKAAPTVCVGSTIALSPAIGGTWTSSNTSIATVIGGIATGVSAGNVTFTFTQTGTLCSSTTPFVTVNPLPNTSLIYHN